MSVSIYASRMFSVCLAASLFSACGPAEDVATADLQEGVAENAQGLTTPPPGSGGFTYTGRFHFKNGAGTNLCAYRSSSTVGTQLGTQTCSSSSSQLFDVFQSPVDGRYFMCVPDSLVKGTLAGECDPFGGCDPSYPAYIARCLVRSSTSSNLALYNTGISLSFDGGKTYKAQAGLISNETGGILGYVNSPRKLTKDSGGKIVLGNFSGNSDQRWTVY